MKAASPFEIIPSIDLLEGAVVRLAQGRYDDVTVFDASPEAAARRWASHRIPRFHVVDLDGARDGVRSNEAPIRGIVAAMGEVPVQLGGGIRGIAAVEAALELGIDRVILGTVALREPEILREAARRFPGRVVLGIDARDGKVAVEGWRDVSEVSAQELARRFEDSGVAAIVYTDIGRDGMLSGAERGLNCDRSPTARKLLPSKQRNDDDNCSRKNAIYEAKGRNRYANGGACGFHTLGRQLQGPGRNRHNGQAE